MDWKLRETIAWIINLFIIFYNTHLKYVQLDRLNNR